MSEYERWEGRFAATDYVFGTEPNVFLAAQKDLLPKTGSALAIADGEGRNGVWLAQQGLDVTTVDASLVGIDKARKLATSRGVAIDAIHANLETWEWPEDRFDVIVSNPPYVAARDPHLAQGDLRFEPRQALTDESDDGLSSLRAIVSGAPAHLLPGGWLLVEHGYDQAEACRNLLADAGFVDLVAVDDLAGIARVAAGRRQ